jgi:prepilin-type N-terminal cleavage/methylation domain-containing protein
MNTHPNKGFTIIETLVAIFILTVAIMATLNAAQLGLQSSLYARDQITAYYLAEEAIEQVRNVRDSNFVSSTACDWLTNEGNSSCYTIPAACIRNSYADPASCRIDVASDLEEIGMSTCSGSSCLLKLDSDIGYNYSVGNNSKFTRTVDIEQLNDHEVLVTVRVKWVSGPLAERTVTMRTSMFDWNDI